MRLNIAKAEDQTIEGYENILADKDVVENVEKIINNSCTEVLCLNALENVPHEIGMNLFSRLINKVRNHGVFKIAGLDFRALSNSYVSDKISTQEVNEAISNLTTVYDYLDIARYLQESEFLVETLVLKGQTFQIQAKRVRNNA
jgi:hypothetical protein